MSVGKKNEILYYFDETEPDYRNPSCINIHTDWIFDSDDDEEKEEGS